MTNQEIISRLKRLKVEAGLLACLGCGHEHNCSTGDCAIMRATADLIENQQREIETLRKANSALRERLEVPANG